MTAAMHRLAAIGVVLAAACARVDETPAPHSTATPSAAPTPTPSDEESQRLRGAKYYAYDCAACHGQTGQGAEGGPPVIGLGALPLMPPPGAKQRTNRFATAADVHMFLVGHMPADMVGQMPTTYFWDVLDFLLSSNGIDTGHRVLDEAVAPKIVLHR